MKNVICPQCNFGLISFYNLFYGFEINDSVFESNLSYKGVINIQERPATTL